MSDAGAPDGRLCSLGSQAVGEMRAGTAPHARLWVLVEQPGAWGHDALADSHLPDGVAESLSALAAGRPVRVGLIRAPGGHADPAPPQRALIVARTDRARTWISHRVLDTVDAVAQLDVSACLSAESPPDTLPGVADPRTTRALLVCTNAKRDRCCALLGRPLAARLAAQRTPSTTVWETSHTGGHRFAPTFVSLPDGYLYGGPDAASGSVEACRGRSSLPPPAQAAELAVLRAIGAPEPRALVVRATPEAETWQVEVEGSMHTVRVNRKTGPDRPESCGKPAVPSAWFDATVVDETV